VLVDGDNTITQSLAIVEYLEETYPQPPLLPHSPASARRVRALALAMLRYPPARQSARAQLPALSARGG